jgi:hypothetical protein
VLQIKGKQPGGLLRKPYRQRPDPEKATGHSRKGKSTRQEKASKLVAPIHSFKSRNHIHSHSSGDEDGFSPGVKKVRHAEFEQVFKMWPNEDKEHGKALGAWINKVVKPGHDPEKVLRRAEKWCRYWDSEGTRLIPYLGKWLADGGWKRKPPESAWDRLMRSQQRYDEDHPYRPDDGTADPDADCCAGPEFDEEYD